ncbi:MAG: hypothetical protein GXO07_03615 [Crenarchaeota archaeon]|nr:hypothetical protein [Thermoproteota archaeon]
MILLGGINGTGKTSTCKAIEKLYGLKCSTVEPACYEGQDMLLFEVYAYGMTMFRARGDVVDESPLTHHLYVRAIPSFTLHEEEPEEYVKVAEGMLSSARKLKAEGHRLVWLTADPVTILERLKVKKDCGRRPFVEQSHFLLGTLKSLEMNEVERWRSEGLLDLVIDTTEKKPEDVAREVVEGLGEG